MWEGLTPTPRSQKAVGRPSVCTRVPRQARGEPLPGSGVPLPGSGVPLGALWRGVSGLPCGQSRASWVWGRNTRSWGWLPAASVHSGCFCTSSWFWDGHRCWLRCPGGLTVGSDPTAQGAGGPWLRDAGGPPLPEAPLRAAARKVVCRDPGPRVSGLRRAWGLPAAPWAGMSWGLTLDSVWLQAGQAPGFVFHVPGGVGKAQAAPKPPHVWVPPQCLLVSS